MTIPNEIIYSGKYYPLPQVTEYEYTSTVGEIVAGRILTYGTAVTQLKLAVANKRAVAVARKQSTYPGINISTGFHNSNYAQDEEYIDHAAYGPFLFQGCLDDGQVIVNGDPLTYEATTGKLQAQGGGIQCAIAFASASPSGADDDSFLSLFTGDSADRWYEETLTVTTNVGTLTYVPIMIEYVEAVAGTTTGGIKLITAGTVATTESKLARSSKTLTFYATDAVTSMKVRYTF